MQNNLLVLVSMIFLMSRIILMLIISFRTNLLIFTRKNDKINACRIGSLIQICKLMLQFKTKIISSLWKISILNFRLSEHCVPRIWVHQVFCVLFLSTCSLATGYKSFYFMLNTFHGKSNHTLSFITISSKSITSLFIQRV